MKKYSIFNITRVIANIHFFLSIIGAIIIVLFANLKKEEIPQSDGKLLNLQEKYISIKTDWDVKKDYSFKTNNMVSPTYYLEKSKESGLLHIKATDKTGIFIIIQSILACAIYILIAYFLKEILNSISPNKAFSIQNAYRIRNIGLLIISGGALDFLHGYFLSAYVYEIIHGFGKMKFQTTNLTFNYQNSFFVGLLILALYQVYKTGVEIQAENELTV